MEAHLDALDKHYSDSWCHDDYIYRVHSYLQYSKECGLSSRAVADSCIDLAETYTTIPEITEMHNEKLEAWRKARKHATKVARRPITINMELDPLYFEAILCGSKTYEGRAYKPDSNKNYPDIRRDDCIRFRLSTRQEWFVDDALSRGLHPDRVMECTVKEIYFAPTVHGMYQIPQFCGLGFQPMISGPSEMLQLQRAAVYHTFPGYHDLICEHGFLGIHIEHPQLVAAN